MLTDTRKLIPCVYRGADKSLARPTSLCILFDGENISFDANLVTYIVLIFWKKLHNEELSDLCSLSNIVRVVKSRRMRWAGHVARMGVGRELHRVLVGNSKGKRPLGRPRRRWEDNIKMDLQEVGGGCGDWMELAQDRDRWRALVSTVMNLRVPKMRGIS